MNIKTQWPVVRFFKPAAHDVQALVAQQRSRLEVFLIYTSGIADTTEQQSQC